MASPILWQNSDRSVTLIDIPRSISAAQGDDTLYSSRHLLSTHPLQSPFQSNEPKSTSARAKLEANTIRDELHSQYQHLLQRAIEEVNTNHTGDWCLPRPYVEQSSLPAKKRRLDDADAATQPTNNTALPDYFLSSIAGGSTSDAETYDISLPANVDPESDKDDMSASNEPNERLSLSNPHLQTARLRIKPLNNTDGFSFHIPPKAAFYLGDCSKSKPFRDTVRKQANQTNTQNNFDFILLDPPWPNRSVKRTHKTAGSTYVTSPSVEDIRDLILNTHLDILMSDECLVAVWITNKPSIRDLVVGENGIFECWSIDLVEEWIWLKTTVHGEPVTQLDGVWRKPYEVLLLGRRRGKTSASESQSPLQGIKRRVLIGVPDLHSRKPCLKTLIEPMMRNPADYRALEVFARHLVAGWWSWGDECIKFNWEGYWCNDSDD